MKFIIKNKTNWYAIVNLLILLMIPIFILAIFIALSIASNIPIYKLSLYESIFLLIVTGFGFYILNWILWQLKGYEEIEFNKDELIIKRKGKLINDKLKIQTSIIQMFEEQAYTPIGIDTYMFRNPLLFSRLIGESGGRILVKYGRKKKNKVNFGLGLTPEEARTYAKQMNDILRETRSFSGNL